MKVSVVSEKAGYLYLLYRQVGGSTKCLFPNLYERDNAIRGGREITIPTERQGFKLRCGEPFGNELLMAIVTERPIAVERLGVKSLTKSVATDIDLKTFVRGIRKGMDAVAILLVLKKYGNINGYIALCNDKRPNGETRKATGNSVHVLSRANSTIDLERHSAIEPREK